MRSTRARWALVALFVLAACSSGEASETSAAPAPSTTTTAAPTTTVTPATTTSLPPTTTTDDGLVGDPEALRESFEELERLIAADITYDEPVPIPDLTNPDPVVALAEAFRFEVWLMENGPHSVLGRETYNYPMSPRFSIGERSRIAGAVIDTRVPGDRRLHTSSSAATVVPIERGAAQRGQLATCQMGASLLRSPTVADRIRR